MYLMEETSKDLLIFEFNPSEKILSFETVKYTSEHGDQNE
jgi:hypothetical protein